MAPPFIDDAGRVLVPLLLSDFDELPATLTAGDAQFQRKDELHITLVGSALAARIAGRRGGIGSLRGILGRSEWQMPWRYRTLSDGYRVRKTAGGTVNEALIVMAEVEHAPTLYDALDRLLGESLARPPLHVTLFIHGDRRGVGLPSLAVLNDCIISDWTRNSGQALARTSQRR